MPRTEMLAAMGFPAAHADALGHTVTTDLTATGVTNTDAYPVTHTVNVFTTVALNTGARLPAIDTWKPGWVAVGNLGASNLNVYPAVGEYMDNAAVNVPRSVPSGGGGFLFFATIRSNGQRTWMRIGLG